jgi:hypothetical protein
MKLAEPIKLHRKSGIWGTRRSTESLDKSILFPIGLLKPRGQPQVSPLRYPGFPVEVGGAGELNAAFLTESRTRGPVLCRVAGNPGTLRSR